MLDTARRRRAPALVTVALALLFAAPVHAQPVVQPWEHIDDTLAGVYSWPNVMFHVGAAGLTPLLAHTADLPVQEYFQFHDPLGGRPYADVAYYTGWSAPVAVPAGLYLGGLIAGKSDVATAGAAAIQAVVLETVVVSSLKWITDRAGPFPDGDPRKRTASSRWYRSSADPMDFDFNPFKISEGLRWPSGHTAAMFALVSSLVAFHPDEPWIAAIGYPIVVGVGLGMIEGDYHWMSDVVAGALIGHVIGWVTGTQFRHAYAAQGDARYAKPPPEVRLHLVPTPRGLALTGVF
jgi:membrane-associated phospholipid phosphatase